MKTKCRQSPQKERCHYCHYSDECGPFKTMMADYCPIMPGLSCRGCRLSSHCQKYERWTWDNRKPSYYIAELWIGPDKYKDVEIPDRVPYVYIPFLHPVEIIECGKPLQTDMAINYQKFIFEYREQIGWNHLRYKLKEVD